MSFTTRNQHLNPEGAYQVLTRANQLESAGREIVHLEIGQPDYATFENISQAGIEAIRMSSRVRRPTKFRTHSENVREVSRYKG